MSVNKPFLTMDPNPVICIHNGALPAGAICFAKDQTRVHIECYDAWLKGDGAFAYS